MRAKIGSIKEVSLVDVLFHPSFVIWFSGCNFRCPWCHNGPLVFGEGELIEIDEVIEKIRETKDFIDFVHVTGGEPTLQEDALLELFKGVKEIGLKTSLNTNGSRPKVVEKLLKKGLLDHIAIDVKAPLEYSSYSKVVGIYPKVKNIERTLRLCRRLKFVEIRTTVIPGLITGGDVMSICKKLKTYLNDFHYVLQQLSLIHI